MGRKKKELPEIEGVEITGIAAEGKSIARVKLHEGDESPIVVFVPFGAPGDIVNLKIDKRKHNYAEAHITKIVKPSPIRIEPKCEHFGVCGGCKWQHIPYEEQLKYKRQQVVDALERIAKVDIPEVRPTLGSEKIWGYRNKMEYTFSNKRWKSWEEMRGEVNSEIGDKALGFHIPGSFDKVLHINKCELQDEKGNRARDLAYRQAMNWDNENVGKEYIRGGNIFYDIKGNHGFLRTLMIRNTSEGEIMNVIVFGDEGKEFEEDAVPYSISYIHEYADNFDLNTNIGYVINTKQNDSITDLEVDFYDGRGYMEEKMGDLKFKISPKSFYQTNSQQAEVLYRTAAEFAGLTEENLGVTKPVVYDLYTGAGTIANYVAKYASKVIGIEYVEDAVKDARINSKINGISNTEFYAGDMKDVLNSEFISTHGRPDIIIVDPPRAGMHEDVVKTILKASPEVIVYVSCNPATQARDVALMDNEYKITAIQPVDMFPHTHHVENVIKLEKRK